MWHAIRALPVAEQVVFLLVALAAIVLTVYPLAYTLLAPWYRSAFGRVLMAFVSVTAVLVDMTLVTSLSAIDGHVLGERNAVILELGAWGLLLLTSTAMLVWLLHVQVFRHLRAARRARREAKRPTA